MEKAAAIVAAGVAETAAVVSADLAAAAAMAGVPVGDGKLIS